MIDFRLLIFMPMLVGFVLFILPESLKIIKGVITLIISAITLYYSFLVFSSDNGISVMPCSIYPPAGNFFALNIDGLSKLIVLFVGFFGFMYALYSLSYVTKEKRLISYYSYFLITLGASFGAALSDNMILFVFFWGLLGLTLYKLIKGYDEASSSAAKKTLVLIGASDSILILGIGLLFKLSGSYHMSEINLTTTSAWANGAFICLLIASFTKAGALPFHTWVPDYVEKAPASTSALLPASLDKLLGIYFLARIIINLFTLTSWATLMLLIVGGITIIAAVMMALVQHNFKKLLGYHAVSQVGYMITGLALGTPLGIAAGLFHMINNAIYKGGLFLTAGSVDKRTGKNNLSELGGLSKLMPITFFAALVFALSISGIPPFNGFYSKWMIYRGIIDFGSGSGIANQLWIVWLVLAVFGSALTLASFIKLISGIYLGRRNPEFEKVKEVSILMWLPQAILALACIVSGIFAATWVIPKLFNFGPYIMWVVAGVAILLIILI